MGRVISLDLPDEMATRKLGRRLAAILQPGLAIALHGSLGAGKTTLARAIINALTGDDEEVPSPTYTLLQTYEGPEFAIWHFDLYRIRAPEDVIELGWHDAEADVMIIEWPHHAGRFLPQHRLDVFLDLSGDSRKARLEPRGEGWQRRLDDFCE